MSLLKGKKILLTRSEDQSAELRELLISEGAEPVDFPTIAIVSPDSFEDFDAALKNINSYEWVLFTSVNGVNAVFKRASDIGIDIVKSRSYMVAAVGKGTAGALKKAGIEPDIMPEDHSSEGLIKVFCERDIKIKSALIFASDIGRETLRRHIATSGGIAKTVIAYRTVKPEISPAKVAEIISMKIDAIIFTSPSTFRNFREIFGSRGEELIKHSAVFCLGKITAAAVSEAGFIVAGVAKDATPEGIVSSIKNIS